MDWKDIAGTVAGAAPVLGGLLGGPLGSAIGGVVAAVLGTSNDPVAVASALNGQPGALDRLKELNRHLEAMQQIQAQGAKDAEDAATAQMQALTERIGQLEGTASDLKGMPVLGPLMLFLRGAARPVIEYCVIYMDYMVFSGGWHLPEGALTNCFWLVNAVVLSFLFGERAIKNVAPFVSDMLAAKRG